MAPEEEADSDGLAYGNRSSIMMAVATIIITKVSSLKGKRMTKMFSIYIHGLARQTGVTSTTSRLVLLKGVQSRFCQNNSSLIFGDYSGASALARQRSSIAKEIW